MTLQQPFGGPWTEEKLRRVRLYMQEYMKIFKANVYARRYITNYVDAFAGTGGRNARGGRESSIPPLFDDLDLADIQRFYKGSARIALEVEPPFDQYWFIEQNPELVSELEMLRGEYPHLSHQIEIHEGDANMFLQRWCRDTDWDRNRALVFLDPFGMSVDWSTLQSIAHTKGIDLWILLPVGSAINRMLPRQGLPDDAWARSLTRIFGTEDWIDAFYRPRSEVRPGLPGVLDDTEMGFEKVASFRGIGEFFVHRLKQEFAGVSDDFLMLYNSRKNPIFMLFFAAANKRGADPAVRIASYILRR